MGKLPFWQKFRRGPLANRKIEPVGNPSAEGKEGLYGNLSFFGFQASGLF